MSQHRGQDEDLPEDSKGPTVDLVRELLRQRIGRREFLGRAAALGLSPAAAGAILTARGFPGATTRSVPERSRAPKPPTSTLTWRPLFDVQNMDPALLPGVEDPTYAACFFEGLLAYKPGTNEIVHCLADSFEASADGRQYHFTLKEGISFQKGYGEVRASDVKYSYERIAGLTKPKINSPFQQDWAELETVRVDGKYSGTIINKEPFAPTVTSTLAQEMSGAVIPEKAVEKLGKSFGTNPVGSGPYEWTSWVPGQKLVMTKFADYGGANKTYANKYRFEEIETLPISNDATAYSALQSGELNYCELGTSTVKTARANSGIKVHSTASGYYYWLAMNVTEAPLDNIWLRRAIRSAIDVPGIIRDAYNGLYTRANSIIPKNMPIGYWPDAPVYNQNIRLARSYMRKARLSHVELKLNVDNSSDDETAAEVIAANLAEIGIKVNVLPVDSATFQAIPGPGGGGAHPQLVYFYYSAWADPIQWFEWWTCAQIGLWNWDHWCSPKFTALTNEALHTTDVAKRTKLYIEAQKLWDQEAGMVWICDSDDWIGCAPYVRPSFQGHGGLVIWNTTAE